MSYSGIAERVSKFKPEFKDWTDSQIEAFKIWGTREDQRLLLFYPTGKGKTLTSLAMMAARGYDDVIVIAPPKTQPEWKEAAMAVGIKTSLIMSHEKFRMPDTKLPRDRPLIVDEFHKLGGHDKNGYMKLSRMASGFPGLILCSATPNYNDAERCYGISYILDRLNHGGGFLAWIYRHCRTVPNPFARTPIVEGFLHYDDAAHFLSSQEWTAYIEDEAEWMEEDLLVHSTRDLTHFNELGLNENAHRIMTSEMEARHTVKRLVMLTDDEKLIQGRIFDAIVDYLDRQPHRKFLVFSQNKVIAKALYKSVQNHATGYSPYLITGDSTEIQAIQEKNAFIKTEKPAVLIGTAALATGVDGIDKVCHHLIILDDTDDATMRRQLIGRVLPRGVLVRDTIVTRVVTTV